MATERSSPAWPPYPVEPWPPDDTEESILGTDLHQGTITNLRLGINGAARLRRVPGQPLPWQALTQLLLLGRRRPDGSLVRTYPDVFICSRAVDRRQGPYLLEADGAPTLIVEVLSEETYDADLDLVRGKGKPRQHMGYTCGAEFWQTRAASCPCLMQALGDSRCPRRRSYRL